jgi:hypothetical protein
MRHERNETVVPGDEPPWTFGRGENASSITLRK